MTLALLACGGGSPPDVCHQDVAFVEAQFSKYNSCVPDAGDAGSVDLDAGLQVCELAIKSCDGGDLAQLTSELACQQTLASTVECKWFTEADPQADPGYYAYTQQGIACEAKLMKITNPTCANAFP